MPKLLIRFSVIPALPVVAYLLYLLAVGHYELNNQYTDYQLADKTFVSLFPRYLSHHQQHIIAYPIDLMGNGQAFIVLNLILALTGLAGLVFASRDSVCQSPKRMLIARLLLCCGYIAVFSGLLLIYQLFFISSPIHINDIGFYGFGIFFVVWPVLAGYFALKALNRGHPANTNAGKMNTASGFSVIACIPSVACLVYGLGHMLAQPLIGVIAVLIPLLFAASGIGGLILAALQQTYSHPKWLKSAKVLLFCGYIGIGYGMVVYIALFIATSIAAGFVAYFVLNLFLLSWPVMAGYCAIKAINHSLADKP